MTKPKALLLGAATIWPIVYLFLFMAVMSSQVFMMGMAPHASGEGIPTVFKIMFALHFLTMVWIVALMAVYIVHLFKTDAVPQDKKALWAVVLFLGNLIAMPVYWYLYVWKRAA
jgi:hypothetical protein